MVVQHLVTVTRFLTRITCIRQILYSNQREGQQAFQRTLYKLFLLLNNCFNLNSHTQSMKLVATGWVTRVLFPAGAKSFHFATISKLSTWPISFLPNEFWKYFPQELSSHSPPPNVEVKNMWSLTYNSQYIFMMCCVSTGTLHLYLPSYIIITICGLCN